MTASSVALGETACATPGDGIFAQRSRQEEYDASDALLALGRMLRELNYQFTTVTPATHALVNSRPGNRIAHTLHDVFGWSRQFEAGLLPAPLFQVMRLADACAPVPNTRFWQPRVRFSTLNGLLFAHSAFPTVEQNAVFFGPDSYRFVRAIESQALAAERVVDVGCGSGVGGIALASRGSVAAPVVMADVNAAALRMAAVNAKLAGVRATAVHSDVLSGVLGDFDLVIANPPYMRDDAARAYRNGGGDHGEQLAVRITRESIDRLNATPKGGRLLLYTGAAVVHGEDTFLRAVRGELNRPGVRHSYEELDPDVFSEELHRPAYVNVERIAAVFLDVHVGGTRAPSPARAR